MHSVSDPSRVRFTGPLELHLATKENALARTTPTGTPSGRYQPEDDTLLAFLRNL